jgi:hypothetical protein
VGLSLSLGRFDAWVAGGADEVVGSVSGRGILVLQLVTPKMIYDHESYPQMLFAASRRTYISKKSVGTGMSS